MLTNLKGEINYNTIIVGNIDPNLMLEDRSSKCRKRQL